MCKTKRIKLTDQHCRNRLSDAIRTCRMFWRKCPQPRYSVLTTVMALIARDKSLTGAQIGDMCQAITVALVTELRESGR